MGLYLDMSVVISHARALPALCLCRVRGRASKLLALGEEQPLSQTNSKRERITGLSVFPSGVTEGMSEIKRELRLSKDASASST